MEFIFPMDSLLLVDSLLMEFLFPMDRILLIMAFLLPMDSILVDSLLPMDSKYPSPETAISFPWTVSSP